MPSAKIPNVQVCNCMATSATLVVTMSLTLGGRLHWDALMTHNSSVRRRARCYTAPLTCANNKRGSSRQVNGGQIQALVHIHAHKFLNFKLNLFSFHYFGTCLVIVELNKFQLILTLFLLRYCAPNTLHLRTDLLCNIETTMRNSLKQKRNDA